MAIRSILNGIAYDEYGKAVGLVNNDGSVSEFVDAGALSEVQPVVTLSATGQAFTGQCLYRGFVVRAVTGTVNIAVYDNTATTGNPIHTENGVTVREYLWSSGARRQNSVGLRAVFSGGGTAEIDFEVEADA